MVLGDSKDDVEDRDSKASADPSVSCESPFSWRRRCNRCTSSLIVAAIISGVSLGQTSENADGGVMGSLLGEELGETHIG